MPTLFLHIGTHKTGSTAIQHALRDRAAELAGEGIAVLPLPPAAAPLIRNKTFDPAAVESIAADLRKAPTDKKLVLSWEGFSGDSLTGYKNAPVVAESLARATAGFEVRIVVYLRRQDDFLESIYTQKIHSGESYSFEEFRGRFDDSSFDWQALLAAYGAHFKNITVRRYHKKYLPQPDSILHDFGAIIGSKRLAEGFRPAPPNAGYSRDTLEVARLVNPQLSPEDKKRMRHVLQQVGAKKPFENYAFFTTAERVAFLDRYASSNAAVARQHFGEDELFPPPTATGEPDYPGLTVEKASQLFMRAMLHLKAEAPPSPASPPPTGLAKAVRGTIALAAKVPGLGRLARKD